MSFWKLYLRALMTVQKITNEGNDHISFRNAITFIFAPNVAREEFGRTTNVARDKKFPCSHPSPPSFKLSTAQACTKYWSQPAFPSNRSRAASAENFSEDWIWGGVPSRAGARLVSAEFSCRECAFSIICCRIKRCRISFIPRCPKHDETMITI